MPKNLKHYSQFGNPFHDSKIVQNGKKGKRFTGPVRAQSKKPFTMFQTKGFLYSR